MKMDNIFGAHDFTETENCTYNDRTVVIDYDDFLSLARSEASAKTQLNAILRALRSGIEPSVILTIFDESAECSIEDLLLNQASKFYVPPEEEPKT